MANVMQWIGVGVLTFLALATFLPLSKLPHGAVRGGAFLRVQSFWGAVILCAIGMSVGMAEWIQAGAAVVALANLLYVAKFTPVWRKQSVSADTRLAQNTDRHISVLSSNVKMSNRNYDALIELIRDTDADIVTAIEVDDPWVAALKDALSDSYPHWIEVPKDNAYGMCILSRLPVRESQVREIVTEDVPSVRMVVTLRAGTDVLMYVVHPEPPVISHDTIGRDSEIAHVGIEAAKESLPVIVTGDLNDVAWSTTTRRFQRLSGLLDPRVGRGFFNSFSAFHWWARWPLDHLFHDPQFRLLHMERLSKIGSDHFPMLFQLALADTHAQNSDVGEVDADEHAELTEMIAEEKKRDRTAIGSDWEDD